MFSRTLALVFLSLSLPACKVVIDNSGGGGHVVSQSGTYSCESGESCEIDVSDDSFDEGFHAVPDEGQVFLGWRKGEGAFCGGASQDCFLSTVGFNNSPHLKSVLDSDETFYLRPRFDQVNSQTILLVKWDAVEDCSQPCYAIKVDGRYSRDMPLGFDRELGVIAHEIGEKSQGSHNSFAERFVRDRIPELPDGSSCDNGKKWAGSSDNQLEYKIVTRQQSHGRVDISVEIENSVALISGDERSYTTCFEPWVDAKYWGAYLNTSQNLNISIKLNMPFGELRLNGYAANLEHEPRDQSLCYEGSCGLGDRGGVDIRGISVSSCGPDSDNNFNFGAYAYFGRNEPIEFSDSYDKHGIFNADREYLVGPTLRSAICKAPGIVTMSVETQIAAATVGDPTAWYEGPPYDTASVSSSGSISISLISAP
jgi:hypothetical protein